MELRSWDQIRWREDVGGTKDCAQKIFVPAVVTSFDDLNRTIVPHYCTIIIEMAVSIC